MPVETSYGISTDAAELADMISAECHYRKIADELARSAFWGQVRAFYVSAGISLEELLELEWKAQLTVDGFDHELMTMGIA